ncbi:hypothetical protein FACS189459_3330 [Bacilli bacterium]|nr:hypothetical protein FACS189459_3330 [Bacilli bacterium]
MRSNSRITKIRANVGEIEIKPNFLTGKWEIKPNAAGAKEVNVKYYGKCFDDGDI